MCVSFSCVTAGNQGWILSHGATDNSKRYKQSQNAECFQLSNHNLAAAPSYITSKKKSEITAADEKTRALTWTLDG